MWQEMQNGLEKMKQSAEDRKAVVRSPMAMAQRKLVQDWNSFDPIRYRMDCLCSPSNRA